MCIRDSVKDVLPGGEKADALRLYNGGKFRLVSEALPGMVVAAAGPVSTRPGDVYKIQLPKGALVEIECIAVREDKKAGIPIVDF